MEPLILEVFGGRLKIPTDLEFLWPGLCTVQKNQPAMINKRALFKKQKVIGLITVTYYPTPNVSASTVSCVSKNVNKNFVVLSSRRYIYSLYYYSRFIKKNMESCWYREKMYTSCMYVHMYMYIGITCRPNNYLTYSWSGCCL